MITRFFDGWLANPPTKKTLSWRFGYLLNRLFTRWLDG